MTVGLVYDVACPYCGAGVDKVCRVARGRGAGRVLPVPHVARRLALMTALAVRPPA